MDEIKLHLGCGKRNWPGWINIDAANFEHIQYHDVTKLPFDDNSVDLIYASHLIAYFDRKEFESLISEWYRVLKIGGILRLATPDADELAKIILIDTKDDYNLLSVIGPLYGKMEVNGQFIYHKTVYNYSTLNLFLSFSVQKGVRSGLPAFNVYKYDHTKTEHPNTGNRDDFYDDHSAAYYHNKLISLNIEAVKLN